ncbi:MAG: hypothetical protein NTV34_13740 [Proteobacteria bacterium]|nr:hypothetical protein [Pseudomonadota bacterium]
MFANALDLVQSKQLVFVTGKGGIGKSVMAASLARCAAASGQKVLLVQQAATDHLGPMFGRIGIGHEGREVLPGLMVVNFNAAGNFKDFIVKHLKHGALFESIAGNRVVLGFFKSIPGFAELMLLGRLYYTLNLAPEKPDLVIVDSYATGHFLSLMTTPQAVLQSGLAGPIMTETVKVNSFLKDESRCGILIVGVPEELVMNEMIESIPFLRARSPVQIAGIIFNRCLDLNSVSLENSASEQFYARRIKIQRAAWNFWQTAGLELQAGPQNSRIPVFKTPELGFIDDPLTIEVARRLVNEGAVL